MVEVEVEVVVVDDDEVVEVEVEVEVLDEEEELVVVVEVEVEVVVEEEVEVEVVEVEEVDEEVVVNEKLVAVSCVNANSAIFFYAYSVTTTFIPPAVAPAFRTKRPHTITSSETGSVQMVFAEIILALCALYAGAVVAKVSPLIALDV